MSGCDRLSDRMPAVSLGRERWSAADEAHLEACADCRAEWELVRSAGRLGAGAAAAIDPARVTAEVLRRMAEEPPARRRGVARWAAGLAAAAGVALAVWGGTREEAPGTAPASTAVVETLGTAQVDSLLVLDDLPLAGWSMLEAPALGDLSADELEQVLRTWEG